MKLNGINHLAMATGDMDATIRFWRDLIGLRLVAGLGKPGYRHYFFEISKADLLAFFEWRDTEPVEEKDHGYPVKGPFIFDHVAFGVVDSDELWQLKDRLEAAGFQVSGLIDHGFIHSIYTWDPNGIPIEFSYNVAGTDVRARPMMADTEPSEVTREGVDPVKGRWPAVDNPTPPGERRIYPGVGSELFHGVQEED